MKIAVMQPYFFPYIGYWQLMKSVDRFVLYDDVNYIKRGWINRNRILINGDAKYITAPLVSVSQNKLICELRLEASNAWRNKMIKMIRMAYKKAPFFDEVFPCVERMILTESNYLTEYLANIITTLATRLSINTEIVQSSRLYDNRNLSGESRIIDICHQDNADIYINLIGGRELYSRESFNSRNIMLCFLSPLMSEYKQFNNSFVPGLSIIDVLMFNSFGNVQDMLNECEII